MTTLVPKLTQVDVECVAGKRERYDWTMRFEDQSGVRCGLGTNDVVEFKLASTAGGAPLLSFTSAAPSGNASSISIVSRGSSSADATGTVTLQAADTAALGGTSKRYELNAIDVDNNNRETQPVRGAMVFLDSIQ